MAVWDRMALVTPFASPLAVVDTQAACTASGDGPPRMERATLRISAQARRSFRSTVVD